MKHRVAVVGAGASGLAAALEAARGGAHVIVLEKNRFAGRKILASGGGKCNLTNVKISADRFHCGDAAFIKAALSGYPAEEILRYFGNLGLLTSREPDGRVFARCGKAFAVVEVLQNALKAFKTEMFTGYEAVSVSHHGKRFLIRAEESPVHWPGKGKTSSRSRLKTMEFAADRVILACGGAGYPQLGGGHSGYSLASSLGHKVTRLTPAIVPLCVKEHFIKELQGLRAEASLRVFFREKEIISAKGEILFTEYGISGPAALDVSRETVKALACNAGKAVCRMNLFPDMRHVELRHFLARRWSLLAGRPLADFFAGMCDAKMGKVMLHHLRLPPETIISAAGRHASDRLAELMESCEFEIEGARSWNEAMVTAGGVSLEDVNPHTFASEKTPGLYLTGELLDVDGISGGYNLHFAWLSGISAGRHSSSPSRA
ncbi:MAG: aminoacetone oxidase family FAD-binding enzyme [bacterium]